MADPLVVLSRNALSRRGVVVLGTILLLSLFFHLMGHAGATGVPADTPLFLRVVDLINDTPVLCSTGPQEIENPYVSHPLYPYTIRALLVVTSDWLEAARWAALLPSILIPIVLCLIAWALDGRFASGSLAGLAGVFSSPLLIMGVRPLSDPLFLFLSGLSFLAGLVFIYKPTLRRSGLAGVLSGLAWATRAVGLFWAVAILAGLVVRLWAREGEPAQGRARWSIGACVFFLVAFAVAGRLPSAVLTARSSHRLAEFSHFRDVFVDGALFAQSPRFRDRIRYQLNEEDTGAKVREIHRLPWSELKRRYASLYLDGLQRNLWKNVHGCIPRTLEPFSILVLPLALGLVVLWRRCRASALVLTVLYAFPQLAIIPAIQLHDRYILPLVLTALPIVGVGLGYLITFFRHESSLRRSVARVAGLVILGLLFVLQVRVVNTLANEHDWDVPYRQACQWIDEQGGPVDSYSVMARYGGIFAYLHRPTVWLPVNALPRLVRFCRHRGTRYLLVGPLERDHNPHLESVPARVSSVLAVGSARLVVRSVYGDPSEWHVIVVEVQDR